MKGDFSRLTFNVTKHFSRVLMQQGRVQLDADWNEQTAILLHYLQTLAKDLIGEHGGPADIVDSTNNVLKRNLGFEILVGSDRVDLFSELNNNQKEALKKLISGSKPPIVIGKGHYYVDGILFENDQDKSFSNQLDYPWPKDKNLDPNNYLVFLDVWERHITYIEDDSIREVALGGPDTTTRSKLVGQVKIINKFWEVEEGTYKEKEIPESQDNWRLWVSSNWRGWLDHWQPADRGLLKTLAKQDSKKDDDPCITSPESSYRGTENQLYRVEIHKHGIAWDGKNDATSNKESAATFKWSRDNGSVVTRVKLNGTELTVDNPRGLSEGKWLELTNNNQELRGYSGLLIKIKRIECDTVTLDITGAINTPSDVPPGEVWPTKARLWESGQISITESSGNFDKDWHKLENGIQIQFQPSTPANQYRSGDYWLIPARISTGDVEWPGEIGKPEPLPPHGVEHHYAPLAIIKITATEVNREAELRKEFGQSAEDIP
jgi:hypothetical protein